MEAQRTRAMFIASLRRVADALERGEPVRIQVASQRLLVPVTASLSIEHEVEGAEEELEFQLSWRNDGAPSAPRARKATTSLKRKI